MYLLSAMENNQNINRLRERKHTEQNITGSWQWMSIQFLIFHDKMLERKLDTRDRLY